MPLMAAATLALLLGAADSGSAVPGQNGPIAMAWSSTHDREDDKGEPYTRYVNEVELLTLQPDGGYAQLPSIGCETRSDTPAPSQCAPVRYGALSFGPDGRTLAAVADDRIVIVPVDGGAARSVNAPRAVRDLGFSPDGRRLVFSAGVAQEQIWISSLDGRPARRLTRGESPDWSTRGWIAFVRDGQVHRIRPDGRGRRQLTRQRRDQPAVSPSWAPDGKRLAYACEAVRRAPRRDEPIGEIAVDGGVFTIDAEGRHKRQITTERDPDGYMAWGVVWSPDGRRLLVRGGNLYVVDARSRRIVYDLGATELISSTSSGEMFGFDWGPAPPTRAAHALREQPLR